MQGIEEIYKEYFEGDMKEISKRFADKVDKNAQYFTFTNDQKVIDVCYDMETGDPDDFLAFLLLLSHPKA